MRSEVYSQQFGQIRLVSYDQIDTWYPPNQSNKDFEEFYDNI